MRLKSLLLVLAVAAITVIAGCAVDPMEQLSQDTDSLDKDVRSQAVLALANLKDDRATDSLVDVLQSDEEMCDYAGVALVKKGREWPAEKKPNAVVDAVARVAANTHLLDKVRARACWVLGEIGDRQAVPNLKGLLADPIVPVAEQAKKAEEKLGYFTDGRAYNIPMGDLKGKLDVIQEPKAVVPPPVPVAGAKPAADATKPAADATKPAADATKPAEGAKPAAAKPAAKPAAAAAKAK
jgi:HEAT repeat protein